MIEIKLTDGSLAKMPVAEVRRIIPAAPLFFSPKVKAPFSGLLFWEGTVVPIMGTFPERFNSEGPLEERHWILLLEKHALLIHGLPIFLTASTEATTKLAKAA